MKQITKKIEPLQNDCATGRAQRRPGGCPFSQVCGKVRKSLFRLSAEARNATEEAGLRVKLAGLAPIFLEPNFRLGL